jgi:hypothetical protein
MIAEQTEVAQFSAKEQHCEERTVERLGFFPMLD